jgi:hypothetical protein
MDRGSGYHEQMSGSAMIQLGIVFYLYAQRRVADVIRFYRIKALAAPDDPTVVTTPSTSGLTWSPCSTTANAYTHLNLN